ncbi:MAG: GNAT family N-acetyltransferase [Alphaproteobacteria bacterium]|nr:GNAT family N-acetyltransferase [Alphaproteobacteria bacterium]
MPAPGEDAAVAARVAAADPRKAEAPELARVARLMARAFADDPVMSWGFRAARHEAAVGAYMDFAIRRQCAPHDAIFVAPDFNSAAVWLPPSGLGSLSLPPLRMLALFPRLLRMAGWSRLRRVMALGDAMEKHHPPEPPHWYLFFIGVAPEMRGRGLGSSMLEATLKRVDDDRMPAFLDNSNPKNTRLYERHGFRIVTEYRPRNDAPVVQGMWRNARA